MERASISLVMNPAKKKALKDFCDRQTVKTSMNALINGIVDKFMDSKKFSEKPKKVLKKKKAATKKKK